MLFFFKQKTAYEMRISDWSSDVFSSDLAGAVGYGRDGVGRASVGRDGGRAGGDAQFGERFARGGRRRLGIVGQRQIGDEIGLHGARKVGRRIAASRAENDACHADKETGRAS